MASHRRWSNSTHFFKIILERSLQEGKLKVPDNFIGKYGGGMPNPVFLKPPDGTQWEIFWTKHKSGEVWFEKGWNEVARYYSLGHGHLVLFRYEGTCHFEVNIFDMSAMEIDYPPNGNLQQITTDDSDSVEIMHEKLPLLKVFSRKTPLPSSSTRPCKKIRGREKAGRTSNQPNMHPGEGNKSKPSNAELNLIKQELEETNGGSKFSTKNGPKSVAITGGKEKQLTCSEKERALERVNTFVSKNPHFKIVIQPAYTRSCLHIPANFVEQYLKKMKKQKEEAVLLKVSDGRTWRAKYIWSQYGYKLRIGSGWFSFVRDTNLKVGDVCVFELKNTTGISYLVHIFGDSVNPFG